MTKPEGQPKRSPRARPVRRRRAPNSAPSVLFSLLSGLSGGTPAGRELGDAIDRPAGVELVEHVLHVHERIDADALRPDDEGVGRAEPRGGVDGAREEEVPAADRDRSDFALGGAVVDLEVAAREAPL